MTTFFTKAIFFYKHWETSLFPKPGSLTILSEGTKFESWKKSANKSQKLSSIQFGSLKDPYSDNVAKQKKNSRYGLT